MTDLIKIEQKDGIETVSAKELYEFLGYDKSQWSRWATKNIDADSFFVHGKDYTGFDIVSNGNVTKDYALSLDMAKELSMLARNLKGQEARRYFIEVEKRARELSAPALPQSEDEVLKAAFTILDSRVKKLEAKIEEDKTKVDFFNDVTSSKTAISMGQVAKVLDCGMGRTKLFQFLRDNSILRGNNEPYQQYIDNGWFRVIEQKYTKPDGSVNISLKTVVYQKGVDGIRKAIEKMG